MSLRPYQKEVLETIRDAGVSKPLVVLPTGTGKGRLAGELPRYIGMESGEKMLHLAHRTELLEQAVKHFEKHNPDKKVSIEQASRVAEQDADIIVASVQTLKNKRLAKYNPNEFRYIQIDEAHHLSLNNTSYTSILEYFEVLKGSENEDQSKLLVGWTATPNRADNLGLESVFDEIIYSMDLREAISDGWLVDIKGFRVETDVDLSSVRIQHGDFVQSDLEKKVNTSPRNRLIVEKYRELGQGQLAIAFTVDVQHSHDLASMFREMGIPALPLSGQTPPAERARILKSHQSGETRVVVSCGVLSEGTDLPWATVALMTRPTKSSLLYRQQVGRITRPFPAPEEKQPPIKKFGIVIDFCDLSGRHHLVSLPNLVGLKSDFDMEGAGIVEGIEEIEAMQEENDLQLELDGIKSIKQLKSVVESVDLIRPPEVPPEVKLYSSLAWIKDAGGYRLYAPSIQTSFSIRQDLLGHYDIYIHHAGARKKHSSVPDLRAAFVRGDSLLPREDLRVVSEGANWRSHPVTDKQIAAFAKLDRVTYGKFSSLDDFAAFIKARFDKGSLSRKLDQLIARKEASNAQRYTRKSPGGSAWISQG